jgi:hypothetical protein
MDINPTDILKSLSDGITRAIQNSSFGLSIAFPITKVDEASRTVTGIATSETFDSQGERLLYEGSKQAFKNWRGNVREMHSNLAVGKALEISADDNSRSITVKSYISKGAPDTWEKLKDGTLQYYSVGGTRLRSVVKDDGKRVTSEWSMSELSLVDSGANPDSKIVLVKAVDGIPTITSVLEEKVDPQAETLACRLEAVAEVLKVGARPLQSELQAAFDACARFGVEGAVKVGAISPRNWTEIGPRLSGELLTVAKAARQATESHELQKVAAFAEHRLMEMVSANSLGRSSRAELSARNDFGGGFSKGSQLFTTQELEEKVALLTKAHAEFTSDACGVGRACRHFRELEQGLFVAIALLKESRGQQTAGRRRR